MEYKGLKGIQKRIGCGRTKAYQLIRDRLIEHERRGIGSRTEIIVSETAIQEYLYRVTKKVPAFDAKAASRKILKAQ